MKNKEETEAVKSSIQHLLAIIQKNYDVDSRWHPREPSSAWITTREAQKVENISLWWYNDVEGRGDNGEND